MANLPTETSPLHNLLITIPRTASNLLIQILNLNAQSSILPHPSDGYCFLPAISARYKLATFTRPLPTWTGEDKFEMQSALKEGVKNWTTLLTDAKERGRGTYIKEHINWTIVPDIEHLFLSGDDSWRSPSTLLSNPTCIPGELLVKTCPTFLIRHPALTFPSLVRTAVDNEGTDAVLSNSGENAMRLEATYKWHRALYDFLIASPSYPRQTRDTSVYFPIIIDAVDLGDTTLMRRYAAAVGLDPNLLRFKWEATSSEAQKSLGRVEARMKDTLLSSSGVIASKLQGTVEVDLIQEKAKWKTEFGQVLAQRIHELVVAALDDYEWLFERRLVR